MQLSEKLSFFEEKFGPYEKWTEDEIMTIAMNGEYNAMLSSDLAKELMQRPNPNLYLMMESLYYSLLLAEANKKTMSIVEKLQEEIVDPSVKGEIEEILSNPLSHLFERVNLQLVLLSLAEDEDLGFKPMDFVDEEKLKQDMLALERVIIEIESNNGMVVIQSLIMLIFRIQEYYFEITGKDIFTPSDELNKKCDEISDLTLQLMTDAMGTFSGDEEEE